MPSPARHLPACHSLSSDAPGLLQPPDWGANPHTGIDVYSRPPIRLASRWSRRWARTPVMASTVSARLSTFNADCSLVAQRHERIDRSRAQRRNATCHKRRDREQCNHADDGDRVARADVEEQRLDRFRSDRRKRQPAITPPNTSFMLPPTTRLKISCCQHFVARSKQSTPRCQSAKR
jgi:hypothetical protein